MVISLVSRCVLGSASRVLDPHTSLVALPRARRKCLIRRRQDPARFLPWTLGVRPTSLSVGRPDGGAGRTPSGHIGVRSRLRRLGYRPQPFVGKQNEVKRRNAKD